MKNEAAAALGRMGKGRKKTLTPEERERRSKRMHALNARRVEVKFEPEVSFVPAIDNKPNVGDVCDYCRNADCQCSDADTNPDIGAKG